MRKLKYYGGKLEIVLYDGHKDDYGRHAVEVYREGKLVMLMDFKTKDVCFPCKRRKQRKEDEIRLSESFGDETFLKYQVLFSGIKLYFQDNKTEFVAFD